VTTLHPAAAVAKAQHHSADPTATRALGARLGALLQGGEVIALLGDLGAGKTTFVQGLVQGMGSRDRVTSPTFTLVNLYRAGDLEVHHVDAYRLGAASPDEDHDADAVSLGLDDLIGAEDVVVLIEWAEIVPSLLSAATLVIQILADDGARDFHFSAFNARGAEILAIL